MEGLRASAIKQYESADYAAAACSFERLWAERHDVRDLANAANARYAAKHFAHALQYLADYSEGGRRALEPSLAALKAIFDADNAQLPSARRLWNVRVELRLPHTRFNELLVEATYVTSSPNEERPPVLIPLPEFATQREHILRLDPGAWRLRVGPRDERLWRTQGVRALDMNSKTVAVGEVLTAVDPSVERSTFQDSLLIELAPRRRRFAEAAAVVGAAVGAIGAGVAIHAESRWRGALDRDLEECDAGTSTYPIVRCREALAWAGNYRAAAAGLAGAGLGALMGALFGRSPRPVVRGLGLASGLAAAVAGGVLLGLGRNDFNALNQELTPWDDSFQGAASRAAARQSGGALLAGVGAGVSATVAIGWLIFDVPRLRSRRAQVRITTHAGSRATMLGVSGAF